jgi:hypothetical protein
MSHVTDWSCRSCRAVLGHMREGVLWPFVPVESVDGRGVVRVPCPTCGRVRVWQPACPDSTTDALDRGQVAGHSTA